ncbi:MAG: hypothetical protein IE916_03670 [Epsilonproteobacteria bacterium]|nr:hypothetical protein [Campylobacterota bacterium]
MKRAVYLAMLLCSVAFADELERVESIVSDITKLRQESEACKKRLNEYETNANPITACEKSEGELNLCRRTLDDERQKNRILLGEIENSGNNSNETSKLIEKINGLESQIKIYENELLLKDMKIENLEKRAAIVQKNLEEMEKKLDKSNELPQLAMKEEFQEEPKEIEFEAATFRLLRSSDILDDYKGKIVDRWEEKRTFTASVKKGEMIKIGGYFVDRKWQRAKENLWVKAEDAAQR